MVLDASAFVAIGSDRVIPAAPLEALVAALASLLRDTVVETSDIGHQHAAPWIAPSQVTVLFRHTRVISAVLRDLRSSGHPLTGALVSLYRALDPGPSAAKTMPLAVRFQRRASESFCFVFGHGLAPLAVAKALRLVPMVFHAAERRLERNKRAFQRVIGDIDACSDEHRVELVHLYSDPFRGWEVLA
jgi:hypothetical protein